MRHIINFIAPAIFFGIYLWRDSFYDATIALVVAAICTPLLLKLCRLEIRTTEWTTAALIVVFGSISLMLRDTFYLQIKTTVINWLFAFVIIIADYGFRKNLPRGLLNSFFTATDSHWRRVSNIFATIFIIIGGLNIFVITTMSEESWVWIKTFIYPAISFVGIIGALIYLANKGTPISKDS